MQNSSWFKFTDINGRLAATERPVGVRKRTLRRRLEVKTFRAYPRLCITTRPLNAKVHLYPDSELLPFSGAAVSPSLKMWFRSLAAAVVVLTALRHAQYDDVIPPLTKNLNPSYDYVIGTCEQNV